VQDKTPLARGLTIVEDLRRSLPFPCRRLLSSVCASRLVGGRRYLWRGLVWISAWALHQYYWFTWRRDVVGPVSWFRLVKITAMTVLPQDWLDEARKNSARQLCICAAS
jgi:hypothetical protein